jgi:hypothetical protein
MIALLSFLWLLVNQGWGSAAAYTHAEGKLTRGNVVGQSIGPAAVNTTDILCQGDSELTVMVDMNGAASGDLAVTVVPFETNAPLTPIRSTGPTFGGSTVNFTGTYDVSGIDKARIAVKNNNVGAQTLNRMSWRLS